MTQRLPPNEMPEPDEPETQSEPRIPRVIVRLGWIALAIGLFITLETDLGRPEVLTDGTLQTTWMGIAVLLLIFGGFAIIVFSASPWGLLQAVCIITGLIVGFELFTGLVPNPPHGVGLIGGLLGLLAGWGIGYLLTWALSRLFDAMRPTRRRRADLQQRIDRQDKPGGHDKQTGNGRRPETPQADTQQRP